MQIRLGQRTIMGVGAAAVLLGFIALGCQKSEIESPPSGEAHDDLVLARVGSREIQVRDLNYKIKIQLPVMDGHEGMEDVKQKREVLRQMIQQYAWVDLGERMGYDKEPEFLGILELSRKFILARHATERAVYDEAVISDAEVQSYYEENLDEYQTDEKVRGSMILVDTLPEAERIRRRILAGEDFAALARAHSTHEHSRESGGVLGSIAARTTIRGFADFRQINRSLFDLSENEVSEPIETPKGWAILRAYGREQSRILSLEEIAEEIREKLFKKRANQLFASTLQRVQEELGAEIVEEAWAKYSVSKVSDVEALKLATADLEPNAKILIYKEILDVHAESPVCGKARFMIGFLYADELGDFEQSTLAFNDFLEHHPDGSLAESARWMIENMDKGLDSLPYIEQIRRSLKER